MNLSNARATFGLNCRATPTSSSVTGSVQVGASNTSVAFPNANVGYTVRAIFAGASKTFTLATTTNTVSAASAWTAGAAQVETATAAGTITAAGNASVTVTASGMTGSPKTLSVAVANNDTATIWAGKVRTALAADADVSALFTVGGTTTAISLTRKPTSTFTVPGGTLNLYAGNIINLNIALADGTSTGITAAATSANTTAGVLTDGVKIYDDATDFEGVTIPTINPQALLFTNEGSNRVDIVAGTNSYIINPGGFTNFSGDGATVLAGTHSVVATATNTTDLSITVIGAAV